MPRALSIVVALSLALTALTARPASAQAPVDLTTPDPIANELADLRLALLVERRDAGVAILVAGLASVVGGGLTAAFGHEDPFLLAFGSATAGWGAVNAALSFALLDLDGGGARAIEADRVLRYEELARAREAELRRQHEAATLFALNAGLDVFYVATAALLFALADSLDAANDREMLRGYSVAQLSQGAFLFVFDLVEWIAASDRAGRVARVPMVRW